MNKTPSEARAFANEIKPLAKEAKSHKIDIGVCVPAVDLEGVKKILNKSMIVGAENVHYLESGAYTGEISIPMLKDLGINVSLVGHSERREYDNETSEKCNLKILALLQNDMVPVYCCGESLETYEAGKTKAFVKEQIITGLKDVKQEDVTKIIIAYEPIWSIGTGKNASKEIAEDVCKYIRKIIRELYDTKTANRVRILYGGSVKPNNIKDYLSEKDVDGALVGGASLKADSFQELLRNIE